MTINRSVLALASFGMLASSAFAAEPTIADGIRGVVAGAKGPEAGVWVIAETDQLGTKFVKIVVTDTKGRYVLPELPPAEYKIWVRGYGLVDSKPVAGKPGTALNLKAVPAKTLQEAAEIYPANYWYSLIKVPALDQFPGTGPKGNGIAPGMHTQQEWIGHMKEQCLFCHQLGSKTTRSLANIGDSVEAWDQRVQKVRPDDDITLGRRAREVGAIMNNNMTRFGRQRALQMFADWTDRVAKGETPPQPPRPAGAEANVVLTMWDWADGHFVHDEITTDKRNPSINNNGLIYGVDDYAGHVVMLDPKTHKTSSIPIPGENPRREHNDESGAHNPMIDGKGRVWITRVNSVGDIKVPRAKNPDYCMAGNAFSSYYPSQSAAIREVGVYDPGAKRFDIVPVCFGSHHLQFASDKDNTLFMSGDANVIGWINTRVYDETHDPQKSSGWCPMVLDTSGDGKITPDRAQWNGPEKEAVDPTKDTRISGFLYAMGVSPTDGSVWFAKYVPSVPSGLVRFETGTHPPETCKTEFFEPPKLPNGNYAAFNARGVDFDSHGVAWVAFGSGQLGRFDRTKCKVLNGPTATGQQCPEGWTLYDSPGPKMTGVGTTDWHYLTWVDQHDVLGLGKDVPIIPGSNSDSLIAFLPEKEQHVVLRVPYPTGFYTRGLDGRIDDPAKGWKGRGLWAIYGLAPLWHIETGEGTVGKVVKFQLRPDPLAF